MKTRTLLETITESAGEYAPMLRKSVYFSVMASALRGGAFVLFACLFEAVFTKNVTGTLLFLCVITVLFISASFCDWHSRSYDYDGFSGKAGNVLRRKLGQHLRQMPLEILQAKRTGKLNASVLGGIDDVLNHTGMILFLLSNAIITPLVVGVGLLFFDWRLGVALLVIVPGILPIYMWIKPKLIKNSHALTKANATLAAETLEYTQGLAILKVSGSLEDKASRFDRATHQVENQQKIAMQSQAPANILLSSTIEIGILFFIGSGVYLLQAGDIRLAIVAMLMVTLVRFAEPLTNIIAMLGTFEMVQSGYKKLYEVLGIGPLPQAKKPQVPDHFDIRFEDVTFSYLGKEESAVNNIRIQMKEHSLTALVGASGSGKTTLTKLLMRFADPQKGNIKIGGIDIKKIDQEQLNDLISMVFQDVYLFDDSIVNNIKMGNFDATEEEVIAVAKKAHCHDFISALPAGYNTQVGEIGANLSGGEKQRIAIARALLKDAPIIILDEPTAALDTYSEIAVQQAINVLVQNKTVIIIAHRLSTIVAAEQILVLDKGEIIEYGNHKDLLLKGGKYATMWAMQEVHR